MADLMELGTRHNDVFSSGIAANWGRQRTRAVAVADDVVVVKKKEKTVNGGPGEVSGFAYTVAHDLRAPLRAINGLLGILVEDAGPQLNEDNLALIDRIRTNASHMDSMIDALLALGRSVQSSLECERLNLSDMAHTIVDNLSAAEPRRAINWRIADAIQARGDHALVGMVLRNLLQNAAKFTRGEAEVTIEFGVDSRYGDNVYFVRDNGRGLDMAYSKSIFEPFHRLTRERGGSEEVEGTGIGLATAKFVVVRHGGRIWVDSKPGCGATFYFTLQAEESSPWGAAAIDLRPRAAVG